MTHNREGYDEDAAYDFGRIGITPCLGGVPGQLRFVYICLANYNEKTGFNKRMSSRRYNQITGDYYWDTQKNWFGWWVLAFICLILLPPLGAFLLGIFMVRAITTSPDSILDDGSPHETDGWDEGGARENENYRVYCMHGCDAETFAESESQAEYLVKRHEQYHNGRHAAVYEQWTKEG